MSKIISTIYFNKKEIGTIFVDDEKPDAIHSTGNISKNLFPESYIYIDKTKKEKKVSWKENPRGYVVYFYQYLSGDYWRASRIKVE